MRNKPVGVHHSLSPLLTLGISFFLSNKENTGSYKVLSGTNETQISTTTHWCMQFGGAGY